MVSKYANLVGERRVQYLTSKREYYYKNKEQIATRTKERRALKPPEWHEARREYLRDWSYKKKYNISKADWDRLFSLQGGVCALCRKRHDGGRGRNLHVDHCHDTGRIRGLLCFPCNQALGKLGDDE